MPLAASIDEPISTVVQVHALRQMLVGFSSATHIALLVFLIELRQIDFPTLPGERPRSADRMRVKFIHPQHYGPVAPSLELVTPCSKPPRLGTGSPLAGELVKNVCTNESHVSVDISQRRWLSPSLA